MRKTNLILVLALVFTLIAVPVWAAPARESSADIGIRSMTMLQNGTAYIADAGGQTLFIRCDTQAYFSVAKIGLEINLQRWNGSSWTTIQTMPFYNTYSSYIG